MSGSSLKRNYWRLPSGAAASSVKGGVHGNKADREADWGSIEILFLSDERVEVRNGIQVETRNYAEMGFTDRRNGKPNQAWLLLRDLAESNGTIRDGRKSGQAWPKIEKRVQDMRKVLRQQFGISADPVPFVEGAGYQARFKIGCNRSFHT